MTGNILNQGYYSSDTYLKVTVGFIEKCKFECLNEMEDFSLKSALNSKLASIVFGGSTDFAKSYAYNIDLESITKGKLDFDERFSHMRQRHYTYTCKYILPFLSMCLSRWLYLFM